MIQKCLTLLCISMLVSACSTVEKPNVVDGQWSYQQVDRGVNHTFVTCAEACAKPTKKTQGIAVQQLAEAEGTSKQALDITAKSAQPLSRTSAFATTIHFDSDSSTVRESEFPKLGEVCKHVLDASEISISGRTDATGTETHNKGLAQRRAGQVAKLMARCTETKGVKAVTTVDAKGACCYVSSNSTPEGRQANRRVEIEVNPPSGTSTRTNQKLTTE